LFFIGAPGTSLPFVAGGTDENNYVTSLADKICSLVGQQSDTRYSNVGYNTWKLIIDDRFYNWSPDN